MLALRALDGSGIDTMFTLSGGHIFPLLDAAHSLGWRIVDVRHEQTATFAAEATAKVTRTPGLAVLTAGPGVTNGISAITGAFMNGSPMLVFGGRAPQGRWGSGSLQELDHVPIVSSITKHSATVTSTSSITSMVRDALAAATSAHRGPVFLDFPLDVVGGHAELPPATGGMAGDGEGRSAAAVAAAVADAAREAVDNARLSGDVELAISLLQQAERPVCIAGSDVYWGHAETELVAFAEACRVPVLTNGLGRGTIPADHELALSRARPMAKQADLVIVAGTPLDFRIGFGRFGEAKVIHLVDAEDRRSTHASPAATVVGSIAAAFRQLVDGAPAGGSRAGAASSAGAVSGDAAASSGTAGGRADWIARLRQTETELRAAEEADLTSEADPIHPARIYGELRKRLERDAIVIGDGGDFVSYAGKLMDSYQPGCFLEPGPYGCLGTGLGYAIGARVAHPTRQVAVCFGDGAFGFSGMDVDTLVRHQLPVVMIVGNNGIWGLEKHPMQFFYGYDVAADLQPATRYDEVVRALGGAGETVTAPGEIGPALDRAFASGVPYLVNVMTDPANVYPRSSNLA